MTTTRLLSDEHLAHLQNGSGISLEVIEARGYRTIREPRELTALNYARQQSLQVPGILMPVHGTDGSSVLSVYRPDIPRVVQDKRKRLPTGEFKNRVIKYDVPRDAAIRLDCPPLCRAGLANPDTRLWITEGVKKADALCSQREIAIALLGVWNFKGRNQFGGVTFLNDWDYIALKGREVIIVFDSDLMQKAEVRNALERLTEHLQRKFACVLRAYLPPGESGKVGVDDFLLEHSIEELIRCVEGPRPEVKAAAPVLELLEIEPSTMRRPLSIIDDRAYAAIWPYVRKTITERKETDGTVTRLREPEITEARQLIIVRDDGIVFGDDCAHLLDELKINVILPEPPRDDRLWSTKAVKAFCERRQTTPAEVFHKIEAVVDRFIDFDRCFGSQQAMCRMISCYIMATWFLDAFNVIGYLWPNGEKGSGKTKLLLLVSELSHLGDVLLAGGSYASLRDLADYGATLAFDDAEHIMDDTPSNADKRALLLAGNRRGCKISVKEERDGRWVTRYVNNFSPRLFSAIRLPDATLESRTIIIPLVKTTHRGRGNADVQDFALWPHSKTELIDSLWAIGLRHLTAMREHDSRVGRDAQLTGRVLEPWRAILAVASWLTATGVAGLWQQMHTLALAYQGDRADAGAPDLTKLVLRALVELFIAELPGPCAVSAVSAVFSVEGKVSVQTKQIAQKAREIAEEEEWLIKEESITPRAIGWILKRLRLKRPAKRAAEGKLWELTGPDLQKYVIAFGVTFPGETAETAETAQGAETATAREEFQV